MVSPNAFYIPGVTDRMQQKNTVARAATLGGQVVVVSELVYGGEAFIGAGSNKHFAVDIGGSTTVGFETEEEAMRFLQSTGDEEYAAHTLGGQKTTKTLTGLGIPDGMVSRVNGPNTRAQVDIEHIALVQRDTENRLAAIERATQPAVSPEFQPNANPAVAPSFPTANTPVEFPSNTPREVVTPPGQPVDDGVKHAQPYVNTQVEAEPESATQDTVETTEQTKTTDTNDF